MKETRFRRTLHPKRGSKAPTKQGLKTFIKRTAETPDDVKQIIKGSPTVEDLLQGIIDASELLLDKFKPGYPHEAGSPEYHAMRASSFAKNALNQRAEGNLDRAIESAMYAVKEDQQKEFAGAYEPLVVRAIAQTPTPPSEKRKAWAVELARYLVEQHPSAKFPQLWLQIPEDDEDFLFGGGFEIFRDVREVHAEKHGERQTLTYRAFERYISDAKKICN